jgi:SAM-dependent methyltransferase
MNSSTLLAFNIDERLRQSPLSRVVEFYWREDCRYEAEDFTRMMRAWSARVTVLPRGACLADQLPRRNRAATDPLMAYLTDSQGEARAVHDSLGDAVVTTIPPEQSSRANFWEEASAHDFELGGLMETPSETRNGQFSPYVLQLMSASHCRREFPMWALGDIERLRGASNRKMTAVDIGCGPISRLRWGELRGWLEIVGVDPLNDIYDVILARHGLSDLECIRPRRKIASFAETLDLGGETVDIVYSANALDHTQDIETGFRSIRDVLRASGEAYIYMNTREGRRQNYSGLHKYDVWIERDQIMFAERAAKPISLLTSVPGLSLGSVYFATDNSFAVQLRRT